MIESGVNQYTGIVPCCRLDADSLVNERTLAQRLVGNCNSVLAQERNHVAVLAPHDVFDERRVELGQGLLLLNVKQDHARRRGQNERGGTAVKDFIRLDGALDALGEIVGQITNLDCLDVSTTLTLQPT